MLSAYIVDCVCNFDTGIINIACLYMARFHRATYPTFPLQGTWTLTTPFTNKMLKRRDVLVGFLFLSCIWCICVIFTLRPSSIRHIRPRQVSELGNMSVTRASDGKHKASFVSRPRAAKRILLWNDYVFYYDVKRKPIFKDCPINNCLILTDRAFTNEADAVIFNVATKYFNQQCQGRKEDGCELPMKKSPHQVWVFHTLEAPCQVGYHTHIDVKGTLPGSFNWTFTHRVDSDVYTPYGRIVKRDIPLRRDFREIARSKTKLIGWLASDCKTMSRREEYVAELQKYVDVDIIGKCGRPCPGKCFDYINKTFKFYLAFENSLAEDYITEKFYRMVNLDVVLISRSGSNYTRLGFRPDWHINTDDFRSPKALADYILMLDRNETLYLPYLEWRNHYKSTRTMDGPDVNWCGFCAKLNEVGRTPPKWYKKDELLKWFYGTGSLRGCRQPTDLEFLKEKKDPT